MPVTILDGSTFCISDENGDIGNSTSGLFASDTRFLSLLRLTINGAPPLHLSSGRVDYFSAAFYLRNPLAGGLPQDALTIARHRFVGDNMQETIVLENETMSTLSFELAIEIGTDFADIMSVKEHDFTLGHPADAPPLPPLAASRVDDEQRELVFSDSGEGNERTRTQVIFSVPGECDDGRFVRYRLELEPRTRWQVSVDIIPSLEGEVTSPSLIERHFGEERQRVSDALAAWRMNVPQLRAGWDQLQHAITQSVSDLAALRIRGGNGGIARLPAAGMPWFMTVFGRDTIITCLQTLLFGPELARNALEVLGELQAREDDASIDAEPGKIVHEIRHGKTARRWFRAYYGTVDATPLYLILLSEVWRWSDDAALVRSLKGPALRALDWIENYGDLDGDGFVEYQKRSERGLDNQSWKDSGDSQRFSDGRFAETPIAPCEVQGYVYDAKLRCAELARAVWRERQLAERLEQEAAELARRFDEAFWIEERGGYYALGLDREKRPIDSLCSNMGHLLWSGIVPAHRVDALVDRLMGEELWSGWGIRTMSAVDAAYNPLSYHNGSVWPHDNALCALGLAKYGRWPEAQRIIHRMLGVAKHFGYQLPEVFSGLPRTETPFPIAYPTSARPQAWAAGAPVLLLQILLGLQPDLRRHVLTSAAPDALPSWIGDIRLSGVHAFNRLWDVHLADGHVTIEEL
ncbi:MAG: glycogen debranching N-terminal domain-containing protein [Gaiellaceae bacterium]|jgi:glycogen debranching enzyme